MIEIYGKDDCGYCTKAKQLLEESNIDFKYYTVGEDIDVGSLTARFSGVRTIPVVVVNGNWIGGYDDLKVHLEETKNGFGDDF
jgi:glutaredoxin